MQQFPYAFNGQGYSYVKIIAHVLGTEYSSVQMEDGVAFYKTENQPFLKLVDDNEKFILHFNVPVTGLATSEVPLTSEDPDRPLSTEWVFRAHNIEQVITLVEMAAKEQEEQ